jgi:hypothetical protein
LIRLTDVVLRQEPFRFLDLSAELRNLIYDYAVEDCNAQEYAPLVHKVASKPYDTRLWQYLALAQTCKQIRNEYRPLWMRDAAVRFSSIPQSIQYIATWMPNEADLKHAPKLLQIAWEHDMDKTTAMRDITPLLRIRAFCSSFHCAVVPYNVVMGKSPDWDMCHFCFETYELEEHGMDADRNMWAGCTCPPMDLEMEDWVEWYTDQMEVRIRCTSCM